MRRPSIALVAAALSLAALAAPAVAAPEPRLTELGQGRFPERSYVLTLPPRTSIDPADVVVSENGARVADLGVEAARSAGGRDLAVVLVIDASRSMKGAPIRSAMTAARSFARRRNPEQPLAVVTFNQRPSVMLPLTTDAARIERALASPPRLGRSTHVSDATLTAVQLLRRAGAAAGSVIVMSDGADTGSRAAESEVGRAARLGGIRVFTVGLDSGAFDASSLQALARAAGGRYTTAATPRELGRIYDSLAAELASEYLVSYRSLAPPGRRVDVFVRVEGVPGVARSGYQTPATAIDPQGPFERSAIERFWRSPLALIGISLLGASGLALAVAAMLRPSGRDLRTRLTSFVSMPEPEAASHSRSVLAGQVLEGAERSLRGTRWWTRLNEELEIARIGIPAVQIVLFTVVATLLVMWLLAAIGPVLVPLGVAVPLLVRGLIRRRLKRQHTLFAEQLAENLQVIASAMRAGHSLPSSMSVVVEEAAEPSKREFQRVVADEQLGVPLEDALDVVGERMDNRDLEQIGMVAALQRDTGGNTAEVLDRVAETLRTRAELRRLIHTLTAQGRLAQWIVSLLPVVLLLFISVLLPGYLDPIFSTTEGNVVLAIAAVMIVGGSLLIRRIVDIKV